MATGAGAFVLVAAAAQAVPATAATPPTSSTGWHRVHEAWQPYVQPDITFPAAQYCGSFDLKATVVRQNIRSRVISRWDNGVARQTFYNGPLVMHVSNATTGKSGDYFMGGDAIETDNSAGVIQTYQMKGPVGLGMPIGSSYGIAPGVYVFRGNHVVQFGADGSQTVTRASGPATDLCTALG